MIRLSRILYSCILLICLPCIAMAQDTTFNRVVTVERDYQPEIEDAQALTSTPFFIQHTPQLNPVIYSTYSEPLSIGFNLHALPAAETHFNPQISPNGIIEGAGGYRNTHFLFGYKIKQKKKMSLDIYANHDAYWGKDALSQSKLGVQVTRHYAKTDFYFGIEGYNEYFSYYGRYYDGYNGLNKNTIADNRQTLWHGKAKIGIQSNKKRDFQYRIQTGYKAFFVTNHAIEHQICSHLDLAWKFDYHNIGINAYAQNNLYSITNEIPTLPSITPKHAIRIEPFYEFKNKHIRLHAGVNLNININTDDKQFLSVSKNLSFVPSPNIQFEWKMMDNIFHLYANATGSYGLGSIEEYLSYNRYLNISQGFTYHHGWAYTPIDATLGFKIRPIPTLLINIYGGYAYMLENPHMMAVIDNISIADYQLFNIDYTHRLKVGASAHYHYRDIIDIKLSGNYYYFGWKNLVPQSNDIHAIHNGQMYDLPNWDVSARIDVHIDSKWSVYSDNYFAGSRFARTSEGDKLLKPIISLNLGGQYIVNRWLSAYLQLNNYLHRKNDLFYGYQSQGIHFLAGVRFVF